jgi:hypothetical protein
MRLHLLNICLLILYNYEEPKRQLIKELLLKNGYTYIGEHKQDDFYSNP